MIDKLEVGKTYVFVSEQDKEDYAESDFDNDKFIIYYYSNGFVIDAVNNGYGYVDDLDGECVICPDEYKFFKLKDDEPKKMKPEDKVTIEISLRELAAIYAVCNNMNGRGVHKIYRFAKDMLDPDMNKTTEFEYTINKVFGECIDYYSIQKDWEELLFGPQETEQQKKVRELREKAQSLLDEADALEKE